LPFLHPRCQRGATPLIQADEKERGRAEAYPLQLFDGIRRRAVYWQTYVPWAVAYPYHFPLENEQP